MNNPQDHVAQRAKHVVGACRYARARLIEYYLRIDTMSPVQPQIRDSVHQDSVHYEPPDYPRLLHTIRAMNLRPSDVVYEIGCGMGRVMCVLARRRVSQIVGIEISPILAERADRNLDTLRGKQSPTTVRIGDASCANYDYGTVYFMFNPFGEDTMRDVMREISKSINDYPRPIRIVYMNPVCERVIDQQEWLIQTRRIRLAGYKSGTVIWETRRVNSML